MTPQMIDLFKEAAQALLMVALTAVLGYIFNIARHYIDALRENLEARIGEQKTDQLFRWAETAVKSAEMIYNQETGKTKKSIVSAFLSSQIERLGLDIGKDEIDAVIERAVYQMRGERVAGNDGQIIPDPGPDLNLELRIANIAGRLGPWLNSTKGQRGAAQLRESEIKALCKLIAIAEREAEEEK